MTGNGGEGTRFFLGFGCSRPGKEVLAELTMGKKRSIYFALVRSFCQTKTVGREHDMKIHSEV
jgi:hypothetical protein